MSLETLIQWQDRFKVSKAHLLVTFVKGMSRSCKLGLFLLCSAVRSFWNKVNNWLIDLFVIAVSISLQDICFGTQTRNGYINTVFYGKHFIYHRIYLCVIPKALLIC